MNTWPLQIHIIITTYVALTMDDQSIHWYPFISRRSKLYFMKKDCTTKRNWHRTSLNWKYNHAMCIKEQLKYKSEFSLVEDQVQIRSKKKHKKNHQSQIAQQLTVITWAHIQQLSLSNRSSSRFYHCSKICLQQHYQTYISFDSAKRNFSFYEHWCYEC